MDTWTKTYEGQYLRETWSHVSGMVQVYDRTAAWPTSARRPYCIRRMDGSMWRAVPGRRYFATAQAAMRAAEKLLAKAAG